MLQLFDTQCITYFLLCKFETRIDKIPATSYTTSNVYTLEFQLLLPNCCSKNILIYVFIYTFYFALRNFHNLLQSTKMEHF